MSPFPWTEIEKLPLILAGPILRRTETNAVTVWVALRKPCHVQLTVYATQEGKGEAIAHPLLIGSRTTFALGISLHVVAVTASPMGEEVLHAGQVYAYDLNCGEDSKSLTQSLNSPAFPHTNISYFSHSLPTFSLPPEDLNFLRIVHGSCRKVHGGGRDALPILDYLIREWATDATIRPHQLFLTGDQIYGDDVPDPILWVASEVGTALLGWEEKLPLSEDGRYCTPSQVKPGERSPVAEEYAGLTAMIHNKPEKAKSHLFSLGEYSAMYLLVWSSLFLPVSFPTGKEMTPNEESAKVWDKEVKIVLGFRRDLWQVRRAIANVPTYMICDDHDVTDDWYLNREWCHRVLSKPLGRRVVQNALLAYGMFQAWGNTPKQFAKETNGEGFLKTVEKWSASEGTDTIAETELQKYLAIPAQDSTTGLPRMTLDGDILILEREEQALKWDYTLRFSNYEVIFLDTRTWRGYPPGDDTLAPPRLLSPTAFKRQVDTPLEETEDSELSATLIVIPTNLVSLTIIDMVQMWDLERGRVFNSDVGDSWNLNPVALSQLLNVLADRRDRVILLSGDIHYACAVRLHYWSHSQTPPKPSVLVQLTASAFKNGELKTHLAHSKLKSLIPEPSEHWLGWHLSPQLMEIVTTPQNVQVLEVEISPEIPVLRRRHPRRGNSEISWELAVKNPESLPDWQYIIEWIPRQEPEVLPYGTREDWAEDSHEALYRIRESMSQLWRNRWLQEGSEVVGYNNISLVSFQWTPQEKAVSQDVYWHPVWHRSGIACSRYSVSLNPQTPPPLPKVIYPHSQEDTENLGI